MSIQQDFSMDASLELEMAELWEDLELSAPKLVLVTVVLTAMVLLIVQQLIVKISFFVSRPHYLSYTRLRKDQIGPQKPRQMSLH
jgi:hypothetical protein